MHPPSSEARLAIRERRNDCFAVYSRVNTHSSSMIPIRIDTTRVNPHRQIERGLSEP